jgi:hypothetical protein
MNVPPPTPTSTRKGNEPMLTQAQRRYRRERDTPRLLLPIELGKHELLCYALAMREQHVTTAEAARITGRKSIEKIFQWMQRKGYPIVREGNVWKVA